MQIIVELLPVTPLGLVAEVYNIACNFVPSTLQNNFVTPFASTSDQRVARSIFRIFLDCRMNINNFKKGVFKKKLCRITTYREREYFL